MYVCMYVCVLGGWVIQLAQAEWMEDYMRHK
jgi:hypothetical protein